MKKDFDGKGWSDNHGDQFKSLIAAARARRTQPSTEKPTADAPEAQSTGTANGKEDVEMADTVAESPVGSDSAAAPQPNRSPHPYENNEEALSKVREKVNAANNSSHEQHLPEPRPWTSQVDEDGRRSFPLEPSVLPDRLGSSPTKQMPMFRLPEEPTVDIDTQSTA
jgi:E3 ubiquitin-protein ligase RAD18